MLHLHENSGNAVGFLFDGIHYCMGSSELCWIYVIVKLESIQMLVM